VTRVSTRGLGASAVLVAVIGMALLPGLALATVDGGCTVTGTATSSGSVDLTTAEEWHLQSTDVAGGSGSAPVPQTSASVGAYALGMRVPIVSGSSDGEGDMSGSVSGVKVSQIAWLGSRFLVSGSSSGDGSGCSGSVLVILDDVNPLLTVLGGGGMALAAIGVIVLMAAMVNGGGPASRIVGLVFGLVGAGGLGLAFEQLDILDPQSFMGLAMLVGGALLGTVVPGLLNRNRGTRIA